MLCMRGLGLGVFSMGEACVCFVCGGDCMCSVSHIIMSSHICGSQRITCGNLFLLLQYGSQSLSAQCQIPSPIELSHLCPLFSHP